MRRLLLLIIVITAFALTACGKNEQTVESTPDNQIEQTLPAVSDVISAETDVLDVEPNISTSESNTIDEWPQLESSPPPQVEISVDNPSANSLTIAIDAGHQAKGNRATEPIGPGASASKPKVSSGTSGIDTKVPEYQLTLDVSLKLRDELIARGYEVVMIRETHDVNISNKERAEIAAEAGANIFVRIHADGSENQSINGILTMCPSSKNPYVSQLYKQSRALADEILTAMVVATDAKNRGVLESDNMSGINWSTMPVTIVEMGLMTNAEEDRLMQTDEYQMKLAKGMADGIDQFFSDN